MGTVCRYLVLALFPTSRKLCSHCSCWGLGKAAAAEEVQLSTAWPQPRFRESHTSHTGLEPGYIGLWLVKGCGPLIYSIPRCYYSALFAIVIHQMACTKQAPVENPMILTTCFLSHTPHPQVRLPPTWSCKCHLFLKSIFALCVHGWKENFIIKSAITWD